MLKVYLADDHAVVREGLKKLVNDDPRMTVVGEASNGKECCDDALRLQPDVVVMDISMPVLNGIEATRVLKSTCPSIKVLVLSLHEDLNYLKEIMKAGASGFVLKLAASNELIHAINTVAANGKYIDPVLGAKMIAQTSNYEPAGEWTATLSAREVEVVRLIAKGFTNKEISIKMHLSIKSVETYKARAITKMGFRGRADFVRYALEKGWLNTN